MDVAKELGEQSRRITSDIEVRAIRLEGEGFSKSQARLIACSAVLSAEVAVLCVKVDALMRRAGA